MTQTQNKTLTFTNQKNSSITINLTKSWNHNETETDFNLSDSSIVLEIGESKTVAVTAIDYPYYIDTYSGSIIASTTDIINYSLEIPITISVISCEGVSQNISRVEILTFSNSSYIKEKKAFGIPQNVTITTGNWTETSSITIDILDPLHSSVSGYPKSVQTNSSGGYVDIWYVLGPTGTYTIYVNDSANTINTTFQLVSCT